MMTNGCSMNEITFIRPPHLGYFSASTSQTLFRSKAHSCLLRRKHEERSFMETRGLKNKIGAGGSNVGAKNKFLSVSPSVYGITTKVISKVTVSSDVTTALGSFGGVSEEPPGL